MTFVLWLWTFLMFTLILTLLFVATAGLMFLFGAPWVPTPRSHARKMLELAGLKPGQSVLDIGSGTGDILILAVKEFGAGKAVGIELHPLLCLVSRWRSRLAGVGHRVDVRRQNAFHGDLVQTDVVCVYLLSEMLTKLKPQFSRLKPGTLLVSSGFRLQGVTPILETKTSYGAIYLYRL